MHQKQFHFGETQECQDTTKLKTQRPRLGAGTMVFFVFAVNSQLAISFFHVHFSSMHSHILAFFITGKLVEVDLFPFLPTVA
jgi:hypothetical protein